MATLEDIEITTNCVNSGTIVMYCDGECGDWRRQHRYMFYTLQEAIDIFTAEHGEEN